jgi:hypothetical protein
MAKPNPFPNNYWEKRGWQWRRNVGVGFIFYVWSVEFVTLRSGKQQCVYNGWRRKCCVYRARKGDRVVYMNDITGRTQGFHDIRTAMRMARFLTQMEKQT